MKRAFFTRNGLAAGRISARGRHAAALALVSWYLMVPGITAQGEIAANEPVSEWEIAVELPTFSLPDCEELKREIVQHLDPAAVPDKAKEADWNATRNKLEDDLGNGQLDARQTEQRVRAGVCVWRSDDFDGFDAFD